MTLVHRIVPTARAISNQLRLVHKTRAMSEVIERKFASGGDGKTVPQAGDMIGMQYTGLLSKTYDELKAAGKITEGKPWPDEVCVTTKAGGPAFDSSKSRPGTFDVKIGTRQVIEGWDQGILGGPKGPSEPMSLGERAELHIPYKSAYGEEGFGDLIPAKSNLIFEVVLKKIKARGAGDWTLASQ